MNALIIHKCVLASNGVVLATENKYKSILYEEHTIRKVEMITKHIGMVYSGKKYFVCFFHSKLIYVFNFLSTVQGMGPDYRLLVKRARKMAQQYQLIYGEPIPTAQLVQRVAMVMQEYTQSG